MFLQDVVDLTAGMGAARKGQDGIGVAFAVKGVKATGVAKLAQVEEWSEVVEFGGRISRVLKKVHAFRFANVPLGVCEDFFVIPSIDVDGLRLFNRDEVKLPFESCWFEMELKPGWDLGLMVEEAPTGIEVMEFYRINDMGETQIQFGCFKVLFEKSALRSGAGDGADEKKINCSVFDPFGHFGRYAAWQRADKNRSFEDSDLMNVMVRESMLAVYLTLVLRSNRKTLETMRAGKFANRRRSEKGLWPVVDASLVTLADDWAPGQLPSDVAGETPIAHGARRTS